MNVNRSNASGDIIGLAKLLGMTTQFNYLATYAAYTNENKKLKQSQDKAAYK